MDTDPRFDDLLAELGALSNEEIGFRLDEERTSEATTAEREEHLRLLAAAATAVLVGDERSNDIDLAMSYQELDILWHRLEEEKRAHAALAAAAALYREHDLPEFGANCDYLCGLLMDALGRHDTAAVLYTQARDVFEAHGEPEKVSDCDVALGRFLPDIPMECAIRRQFEEMSNDQLHEMLTDYAADGPDRKQKLLLLASQGWETLMDPRRSQDLAWARAAYQVASAWYRADDRAHAVHAFQRSAEVFRRFEDFDRAGKAEVGASWSLEHLGEISEAIDAQKQAAKDFEQAGLPEIVSTRYVEIAQLSIEMQRPEDAPPAYHTALSLLDPSDPNSIRVLARIHLSLGRAHYRLGQDEESLRHFRTACDVAEEACKHSDPDLLDSETDRYFSA